MEAFVSFSRKIGARLIAEGIETRRDLAALAERGVDMGQGFLLGRPALEPCPARRLQSRQRRPADHGPIERGQTRGAMLVPLASGVNPRG